MAKLKHFANTRLDERTYNGVKAIAHREDRSVSYVLRRAAIEYVKGYGLTGQKSLTDDTQPARGGGLMVPEVRQDPIEILGGG